MLRPIWLASLVLIFGMAARPEPAAAQTKEFQDMTGELMEPCPAGFENLLPNCAIGLVTTTDGKIKSCFCKHGNLAAKPNADETIAPSDQVESLYSPLGAGKVIDKNKPEDPCEWMTINGKKKYVCW